MSCGKCGKDKCKCNKVITKQGLQGKPGRAGRDGAAGPAGPAGPSNFVVTDGTTTVNNVQNITFTDVNATVTSPSPGIANVSFAPSATVWNDIQNLGWYNGSGVNSFKPQYTIEGNRISFRGLLYLPLLNGVTSVDVTAGNSYLSVASAVMDDSRISVITNANTNNGTPQGRFMTLNTSTLKNFPAPAIPVARDIVFNNVVASRRFTGGGYVTNYRSLVSIRIGASNTVYNSGAGSGAGCLMVFSPFNEEYDGTGTPPMGHDPLAFQISVATASTTALNYIGATDDSPFSIPASGGASPFSVNGHNISSLGGFVINLENLSGFLN